MVSMTKAIDIGQETPNYGLTVTTSNMDFICLALKI